MLYERDKAQSNLNQNQISWTVSPYPDSGTLPSRFSQARLPLCLCIGSACSQNSGEFDKIYIMAADAQALTDNMDNPEKVRQNVIEGALDYLSAPLAQPAPDFRTRIWNWICVRFPLSVQSSEAGPRREADLAMWKWKNSWIMSFRKNLSQSETGARSMGRIFPRFTIS